MSENTTTGRHTREIGQPDGVSDEVAFAWQDRIDANTGRR